MGWVTAADWLTDNWPPPGINSIVDLDISGLYEDSNLGGGIML